MHFFSVKWSYINPGNVHMHNAHDSQLTQVRWNGGVCKHRQRVLTFRASDTTSNIDSLHRWLNTTDCSATVC